jgi:hypothetical protein
LLLWFPFLGAIARPVSRLTVKSRTTLRYGLNRKLDSVPKAHHSNPRPDSS